MTWFWSNQLCLFCCDFFSRFSAVLVFVIASYSNRNDNDSIERKNERKENLLWGKNCSMLFDKQQMKISHIATSCWVNTYIIKKWWAHKVKLISSKIQVAAVAAAATAVASAIADMYFIRCEYLRHQKSTSINRCLGALDFVRCNSVEIHGDRKWKMIAFRRDPMLLLCCKRHRVEYIIFYSIVFAYIFENEIM